MDHFVSAMLLIVAIIHLLPLAGLSGKTKLTQLYDVVVDEPNLALLLQHRAVLFGLLGVFLGYAAFQPALQLLAFCAGFISVFSFLCLAWPINSYNGKIRRVFITDIIALICLLIGFIAHLL